MVAGCGGSVTPIETSTTQVAVMPADLGVYASSIGCVKYEQKPTPIQYVVEWGYCKFEGVTVQAYAFASPQELASFVELLLASGGKEEDIVIKDLVLFAPDSATKIEPLRTALGA